MKIETEVASAIAVESKRSKVVRISHGLVNSYLVGDTATGQWVLIDAGMSTSVHRIVRVAAEEFGPASRPVAILLTHGHFDHVGALKALVRRWKTPVYAHALELPYLTGASSYPPADPTVGGGFMACVISRFVPRRPIDLGNKVQPLPADFTVPGLESWRWIHTPGHTPGHVSFFEPSSGTLIVGDAFVTTKQESALAVLTQKKMISRPPAYFTPDWRAAGESVQRLAALNPRIAATGHGKPMAGRELLNGLASLALHFRKHRPSHGRYVNEPAVADEFGVVSVPPPVADPLPKIAGALAGLALVAYLLRRPNNAA